MRHRDAGLPALDGPASLNRAIKQLVTDSSKILALDEQELAQFTAMPKQRAVSQAELDRYGKQFDSAHNAATLIVAEADLPQLCLPVA